MDFAIRVENISKKYAINVVKRRNDTLRDEIACAVKALFTRNGYGLGPTQTFWALRDISFEVTPGEVVGVIGRNGAGKSTLLKILSRITAPTSGSAEIHGRVGSLLEVGTGFHTELTGRENIYLNGAILGMKKSEIDRKFDDIVAFAEVGQFIDTPIKRYSSGMHVRLAFAVAAHLDPEVLIVDEVLAVGDAAFQKKCLGKMEDVAKQGRTVAFVSHSMPAIKSLCPRGIVLDEGRLIMDSNAGDAIQFYLMNTHQTESTGHVSPIANAGDPGIKKLQVTSFGARLAGKAGVAPQSGADAEFIVGYAVAQDYPLARLGVRLVISDMNGVNVFACSPGMTRIRSLSNVAPVGFAICLVRNLPLIPGKYRVSIAIKDFSGFVEEAPNVATFEVVESGISDTLYYQSQGLGSVLVAQEWKYMPIESET